MITYFQTREEINRLREQIAMLVEALEKIDRTLSKRQGLDWDYGSQEEHDIHEIAQQALAECAVCREGLGK